MEDQKIRAGRLAYNERAIILDELGRETQRRYNDNILWRAGGYNLQKLKNSLQFQSDIYSNQNTYWIDTGNEELNRIADYFEYGTGIHNTKSRPGATSTDYIRPKKKEFMKWRSKITNKMIFAKQTQGVRPVFMMTTAISSVEHDKDSLQRQIRLHYGI